MSNTTIHREPTRHAEHEEIHEPNAVNISGIVKFFIGLSVSVVLFALVSWGLLRYFEQRKAKAESPPPPIARGLRLPPEPRLHGAPGHVSNPMQDIRQFREQETQLLTSYGWVDQQQGIVRIPIEQAKKLIAQKGLQALTPQTAAQPQTSPTQNPGKGR